MQNTSWYRSNRNNLQGGENTIFADGRTITWGDMTVKGSYSSALTVLGSAPLSLGARFTAPTSEPSKAAKRIGTVRFDASPSWTLNPTYTFDLTFSPRITMSRGNAAVGDSAIYRLVTGPSLTANMSDALSAYYAYTMDLRSVNLGHGSIETDALNLGSHEIGLNITAGIITINPAISSDVDMNDGSASVLSADTRVFSEDTSSYNLNLTATF